MHFGQPSRPAMSNSEHQNSIVDMLLQIPKVAQGLYALFKVT